MNILEQIKNICDSHKDDSCWECKLFPCCPSMSYRPSDWDVNKMAKVLSCEDEKDLSLPDKFTEKELHSLGDGVDNQSRAKMNESIDYIRLCLWRTV